MVQVQSTWFPLFDRNPQTFVKNIFEADQGVFRNAIQSIYRSKRYPSHVEMTVLEYKVALDAQKQSRGCWFTRRSLKERSKNIVESFLGNV